MSLKREGGISLKMPQWKRASSHVERGITLAIFLFFSFLLFVMAILVGRMLALHSFDFHLLMTNAIEYFFILALSTFSLDKCLCESFVRFLIELFVLWLHMCKKDNLILKTCQERYIPRL